MFGRGRHRRWFDNRFGSAGHDGGVHRCPFIDGSAEYDIHDIQCPVDIAGSIDVTQVALAKP